MDIDINAIINAAKATNSARANNYTPRSRMGAGSQPVKSKTGEEDDAKYLLDKAIRGIVSMSVELVQTY